MQPARAPRLLLHINQTTNSYAISLALSKQFTHCAKEAEQMDHAFHDSGYGVTNNRKGACGRSDDSKTSAYQAIAV